MARLSMSDSFLSEDSAVDYGYCLDKVGYAEMEMAKDVIGSTIIEPPYETASVLFASLVLDYVRAGHSKMCNSCLFVE
jgi:hypothetical protein